jgi:hypothetical protein
VLSPSDVSSRARRASQPSAARPHPSSSMPRETDPKHSALMNQPLPPPTHTQASLPRLPAARDAQSQACCLAPSPARTLYRSRRARARTPSPPTPCHSSRSCTWPKAPSGISCHRPLSAGRGRTPRDTRFLSSSRCPARWTRPARSSPMQSCATISRQLRCHLAGPMPHDDGLGLGREARLRSESGVS